MHLHGLPSQVHLTHSPEHALQAPVPSLSSLYLPPALATHGLPKVDCRLGVVQIVQVILDAGRRCRLRTAFNRGSAPSALATLLLQQLTVQVRIVAQHHCRRRAHTSRRTESAELGRQSGAQARLARRARRGLAHAGSGSAAVAVPTDLTGYGTSAAYLIYPHIRGRPHGFVSITSQDYAIECTGPAALYQRYVSRGRGIDEKCSAQAFFVYASTTLHTVHTVFRGMPHAAHRQSMTGPAPVAIDFGHRSLASTRRPTARSRIGAAETPNVRWRDGLTVAVAEAATAACGSDRAIGQQLG
eukprot:365535-Chlamydomonas_euryale.AAC.18